MGIEYLRGYLCQAFSQRKASVGGRVVADKIIEHLFESEARRVIERGNLQKRDSDTDHCQRHQNKPEQIKTLVDIEYQHREQKKHYDKQRFSRRREDYIEQLERRTQIIGAFFIVIRLAERYRHGDDADIGYRIDIIARDIFVAYAPEKAGEPHRIRRSDKYGENHYHYRCGEQRGKSLKILARLYIKSHAVAKQHYLKHSRYIM